MGEHSLNGVALVFHELATNAFKYGALTSDSGKIDVEWTEAGDNLVFNWLESGGPPVTEPPEASGFGSKLLRDTVTRQFGGHIKNEWDRDGLRAIITLPLDRLAN